MPIGALFQAIVAALPGAAVLLAVGILFGAVVAPPSWSSQASVWPVRQAADWPREGSTVEYGLRSSFIAPDGSYQVDTSARLTLAFDGAAWNGTCSGETVEVVDGVTLQSNWSSPSGGRPAFGPVDARRGEIATVALLDDAGIAQGCWHRGEDVVVVGAGRRMVGEELEESSAYQDVAITWDRKTGLVQDWSRAVRSGASSGHLMAIDSSSR